MNRPKAILGWVLILALGACGGDGVSASATTRGDLYAALYQGLCQTRVRAARAETARDTFFDRVHEPLHQLANDVARTDRAAAARLLEAKEAVERDLAGDGSSLRADVDRLLEATRRAIVATGRPAPDPCKGGP